TRPGTPAGASSPWGRGASRRSRPDPSPRVGDLSALRGAARQILDAAITAGDAARLTQSALERTASDLVVGGERFPLARIRRVVAGGVGEVGRGKASGAMARAADDVLGDLDVSGLVSVKDRRGRAPRRVRAVEAGHPIPDARGQAAAEEILRLVGAATADDLVLCLISGGGSALTPAPVPGVTLAEKQAVTRLLLEAGAEDKRPDGAPKPLSGPPRAPPARAA